MEGGGATLDSGTIMEWRSTPSAGRFDDVERKHMDFKRMEDDRERRNFEACIREMEEEEEEYGTVEKEMPHTTIVKFHDLLGKLWGWDRLIPFSVSVSWTEYTNYLQVYHSHNARKLLPGVAAATGSSVAALAETCLLKEKDLESLWKIWRTKMDIITLSKSIILNCLIRECAQSVIWTAGCRFSDVCSAALFCISKEADLTCELLGRDADPSEDYLIDQSSEIRLCALSLMNCISCHSVAASAAMLGIAKEAEVMCAWMRENNRRIDFSDSLPDIIMDSRRVRIRTLYFMIKIQEEFSAAVGHKIGREEPASTNGPGGNGNSIAIDEAANTTGGSISDVLNSQVQKIKEAEKFKKGNMKGEDFLEKLWGWKRLLPFHASVEWSGYINYLEKYYYHNALDFAAEAAANQFLEESLLGPASGAAVQIATTAGSGLAASVAFSCLKMEEELVSEWKARVGHRHPNEILPVNAVIHSSLIKECVLSICGTGGQFPIPSAIAFVCITREADLIIELLKQGAVPTDDDIIQQSSVIRMCALGLANLKGRQSIAAAAAMVGMAKEAKMMCDWMKREKKLPSFSLSEPDHELEKARFIRIRTLDAMISILQESSFPSS